MRNLFFIITLCSIFGCMTYQTLRTPANIFLPQTVEGEANFEGKERQVYEKMMLADPATGEIPAGIHFKEMQFVQPLFNEANNANKMTSDWGSRGPWNVGGRTRAMAIDVTNENHLLAGGVSSGVWQSKDGGGTWDRVTPYNMHPGCVSIAQDTRAGHTNIWYSLSGEIYGTSASGGNAFYLGDGLFKSIDDGNTWTPVASTAGGTQQSFSSLYQSGWRVVTNPVATTEEVYIATMGAIYRSTNGGTSWTPELGGSTSAYSYFTDLAVTSTGVFYATLSSDGPNKGIYRSIDGDNWDNITPDSMPNEYNRIVIGINPNNESEVYFLAETPNSGFMNYYISGENWTSFYKYNYLSGNGTGMGGQWTDLTPNLPGIGTQFDKFANQGGYDLMVKVQPGTNNVFIGGANLYRSTDGFTSPNNTTHIGGYKAGTDLPYFELYQTHHPDQHDVLFSPSDANIMYSISDGGIKKTTNANATPVVWQDLSLGYITSQFYTIMIDHATPNDSTLLGGLQDNANFFVNSNNPQAPWKMTINGDGAYGAIADNKSAYYISIQEGKVAKCNLDTQGNILQYERIDPVGGDNYLFINPLVLDPNDNNVMYLPGGRHLWRNNDLGNIAYNSNWTQTSQGWYRFPDSLTGTAKISAIAVSKSPANTVYYGTNNGKMYKITDANSPNATFSQITLPFNSGTAYMNCIAIDPYDANKLIIVFSNYSIYSIWESSNAGGTWRRVAGNLEASYGGGGNAPSIRWVSILPFANGKRNYFCGTSVGLFATDTLITHTTTNPGTQWAMQAPNMIGAAVVPMIEVRESDGLVVAATHGNGVFSAKFTSPFVSVEQKNTLNPILSAYPNPTTEKFLLSLDLPKANELTISVFDIQGKQVFQDCATYPNGKNEIPINVLTWSKGLYFYEVKGKNVYGTGKVVKN
ncbi:MAG: T9SS type A sorting domain-containing protein [Ferruginibacter sp.]